jgi:hypothetical protein
MFDPPPGPALTFDRFMDFAIPDFLPSEYVYDDKNIFEYNCPKKEEFIKKGVAKSRSTAKGKDDWFSKFPRDIELCEELTGGDVKLLEKPPFVEEKTEKVNYKAHFGGDDAKKAAASPKKAAAGKKEHVLVTIVRFNAVFY